MINRLLSGSFASSPSSSSAANANRGVGHVSSSGIKYSAAAMVIPFKLNIKDFEECDGSTIMMECRIFNDTILDVRQCCNSLTRIFFLFFGNMLSKGKNANDPKSLPVGMSSMINETQATSIFFCITKAFQSKDLYLRRLLYLAIKCLSPYANDILMVISSITQDISSRADIIFRANSLRVLSRVIDISMLQGVEKFVKQSLIEGSSPLSSASLVSCIFWLFKSESTPYHESTRRWISSVIPADWVAPEGMSRFHALALGYLLRQNDKGSLRKLLSMYSPFMQISNSNPASMALVVLLIQICSHIGLSEAEFLPSWKTLLTPTSGKEMIALEVCSLLVNPSIKSSEENKIACVQLAIALLSSSSSIIRYSAMRILLTLATHRQDLLAKNQQDIELLIGDPNRSVAILAVTILLKIGNESSIDRVVPHLKASLSEMSEALKRSILDAMTALAIQFPAKASNIIGFFSSRLREEGDHSLKRSLVWSIDEIITAIPSTAGEGSLQFIILVLSSLCEFIEDCEYSDVACDVLHIIGREGPKHPNPILILRHVFNRLLLEVSTVRMAALGTLIKFGSVLESCRDLVIHLIKQRCLQDEDAEIRDRALIFINSTSCKPCNISSLYDEKIIDLELLEKTANSIISGEPSLQLFEQGETLKKISIVDSIKALCKCSHTTSSHATSLVGKVMVDSSSSPSKQLEFVMDDSILHSLYGSSMNLGTLVHQGPTEALTELDTEYIVTVTKYLYSSAMVLRFSCTNTISHMVLEDLHIQIDLPEKMLHLFSVKSSSIPNLKGGSDHNLHSQSQDLYYVFVLRGSDDILEVPLGVFPARMFFSMREIDFIAGELSPIAVPDQYKLLDLEFSVSDYLISSGNKLKSDWASLASSSEKKIVFQVGSFPGGIQLLINNIHSTIGGALHMIEHGGSMPSSNVSSFVIEGSWLGKSSVSIKGRVGSVAQDSYAVELISRTAMPSTTLSDLLLSVV